MSVQAARLSDDITLCTIELQSRNNISNVPFDHTHRAASAQHGSLPTNDELREEAINVNAVEQLQKWNNPRSNISRTFATFLTFAIMGATDAAYGVCYYV